MLTKKEIKQRHFDKIYKNAIIIKCKCGCNTKIKNKDKYGRDKKFVSGHNGRKYKDPTQYKKEWDKRNKEYKYLLKVSYGRKRKVKLIRLLESECSKCKSKYNGKNAAMFQFHHRTPSKKKFPLTVGSMVCYKWKSILKEVHKCHLICSNCHFLEHSAEY